MTLATTAGPTPSTTGIAATRAAAAGPCSPRTARTTASVAATPKPAPVTRTQPASRACRSRLRRARTGSSSLARCHVVHSVTKTRPGGRSGRAERSGCVDQNAGRSLGQSRGQSFVVLQNQALRAGRRLLSDGQQPRFITSYQDNPSATADKFGGYRASGTPACTSYPDLHRNYVTLCTVYPPVRDAVPCPLGDEMLGARAHNPLVRCQWLRGLPHSIRQAR